MSIDITGRAQYQAWQDGVLPPVERVRDGVWSIPVPFVGSPLRYVLVYALACRDGVVLIDAGCDDDPTWDALTSGLAGIGYAITDVKAVLVTHFHFDHLGLAARIRAASGAWVALHRLDVHDNHPPMTPATVGPVLRRHLALHGMPVRAARETVRDMPWDKFMHAPAIDVRLEDQEVVKLPGLELTVVWTPGHSPGHSCFYEPEERLLFAGDHVLPRITPQIAVFRQDDGNPLEDFLRSLDRLDRYDVDEVLPAHEYRFRGLDTRTAVMAEHHTRRLAELYAAIVANPGLTAWKLCAKLRWSRPWTSFDVMNRRFALAETLAHLALLRSRGEAHPVDGEPIVWYPSKPE